MTARAFIIAIENYDAAASLATALPGVNRDAASFRDWLIQKKGVPEKNILCCADASVAWRTAGITRNEIIDELLKLAQNGQDDTTELYFFYSGHGFSYSESAFQSQTDVLVAGDFVDLDNSGGACLKLPEIQLRLWNALGPGDHFYFIDACRTNVNEADIQVLGLGKKFPTSVLGRPTRYTLFTVAEGVAAKTNSGFGKALVEGLGGSGRAKRWIADRMYVTFEVLCDYVQQKTALQDIDSSKLGPGKGLILELNPVPVIPCNIKIENAVASDRFTLAVTSPLGQASNHDFQGDAFRLDLKPFDYFFALTHPSATVIQVSPVPPDPVDMYDPRDVLFQKNDKGSKQTLFFGALKIVGSPFADIELEHLETGASVSRTGILHDQLFPGTYRIKMRERGVTVAAEKVTLSSGGLMRLNLLKHAPSPAHQRILRVASHPAGAGLVSFSESLGNPMANWDLGLWLSLLGASRIVAPHQQFSQMKDIALKSFEDVREGESPIYVLASLEKTRGSIQAGIGSGQELDWRPMQKVSGLTRINELLLPAESGCHLVSFKFPSCPQVTYVVHCIPNRATLVVLTRPGGKELKMRQYVLPMYKTVGYLDPEARSYLKPFLVNPLATVRTMALAQEQFSRNRPVESSKQMAIGFMQSEERTMWRSLIEGDWLDPLMSLMAGYEVIRRGTLENERPHVETLLRNLKRFFSGIADIEILARMVGLDWEKPSNPPVFLDGVLALDSYSEFLPLPEEYLDYRSLWTCWHIPAKKAGPQGRQLNRLGGKNDLAEGHNG